MEGAEREALCHTVICTEALRSSSKLYNSSLISSNWSLKIRVRFDSFNSIVHFPSHWNQITLYCNIFTSPNCMFPFIHYKKTAFLLLFLQKRVMSWKTSRVFQKHPMFARKRLLEDEISLNVTDNKAIKFKEQVNVT